MKPVYMWSDEDFDDYINKRGEFEGVDFNGFVKVAMGGENSVQAAYAKVMATLYAVSEIESIISRYIAKGYGRYNILSARDMIVVFKREEKIVALDDAVSDALPLKGQNKNLDEVLSKINRRYNTGQGSSAFPISFGVPNEILKKLPGQETQASDGLKIRKVAFNLNENIYDKLEKLDLEPSKKLEHITKIESSNIEPKKVISSGVRMIGDNDSLFDTLSKEKFETSQSKIDSIPDDNEFGFSKR